MSVEGPRTSLPVRPEVVYGARASSHPGRPRSITDNVAMHGRSDGWPHCHCQWGSTSVSDDDHPQINDHA
jgi:hypothetical protein